MSKFIKLKFIFLILLVGSTPVLAAIPDFERLQQQQLILQQKQEQQRQSLRNQQQIHKTERLRRNQNPTITPNVDLSPSSDEDKTTCLTFKAIEVQGNTLFSNKYLQRYILAPYLGQCINKTRLYAVQNALTNLYVKRGWSTTRVYFDIQQLSVGKLLMVIQEGRIDNIILQESRNGQPLPNPSVSRQRSQIYFAFPRWPNAVFNLKDFEQGIDQLNRLRSNNTTLDIKPSKDPNKFGYSDIYIYNQKSKNNHMEASLDNSGSRQTGSNIAGFSLNHDNLFYLNDNIYLKYTTSLGDNRSKKYNEAFYGAISIPLGYWTFNSTLNFSRYLTTIYGYYTSFTSSGNTLTQTFSMDRVLLRHKSSKLNAGLQLELRDTKNYIRDIRSRTGSRKSSNLSWYFNSIWYTKFGTILLRPSYQQGLSAFNAKKDPPDLLPIEPRLQYHALKLYIYYNTRINVPLLTSTVVKDDQGQPIRVDKTTHQPVTSDDTTVETVPLKLRHKLPLFYTMTFDSQYSMDTLYGTNQFSIGGEYTIRGFREGNISGDIGYYVRNEIQARVGDLFPFLLKKNAVAPTSSDSPKHISFGEMVSRTSISVFYDYGYVRNRHPIRPDNYNANSGYMSGTGVALKYQGKDFQWSLTYARALHNPAYLQSRDGIEKERHNLYWQASFNW